MTDPTDLPAALPGKHAEANMEKLVKAAVDDIITDMCGRSGGDWWWEPISPSIQREIKRKWARLLRTRLAPLLQNASAPPPGPGWYVLRNAAPPAFRFYGPLTLILGQDESVRITPDVPRWLDADELAALTAAWPSWAPATAPEQWTLDPAGNPPGGLEAGG